LPPTNRTPEAPERGSAAAMAVITLKIQNRSGKSVADVQIGSEVRGTAGWWAFVFPHSNHLHHLLSRFGPA